VKKKSEEREKKLENRKIEFLHPEATFSFSSSPPLGLSLLVPRNAAGFPLSSPSPSLRAYPGTRKRTPEEARGISLSLSLLNSSDHRWEQESKQTRRNAPSPLRRSPLLASSYARLESSRLKRRLAGESPQKAPALVWRRENATTTTVAS